MAFDQAPHQALRRCRYLVSGRRARLQPVRVCENSVAFQNKLFPLRVFQHIRAALVKFAGRALPPSLPLVPPALGNGTTSFSFQNEGNEAQAGRVSK